MQKISGIKENSNLSVKIRIPCDISKIDDDTEQVETDLIFNLAIKDPNEHLQVLQRMMEFLNNKEVLLNAKNFQMKKQ